MKIAIMGSGGIGAYTGGRLVAAGEDVTFIARGQQLNALRENGLTIKSPQGNARLADVTATSDPADAGIADIVIFSVKLWDTESAAAAMLPMVGPSTLVITFQNGIDSADALSRFVPREQVVRGAYHISAHITEPGVVGHTGADSRMVIDGLDGDARIAGFKSSCDAAVGLVCDIADPAIDFIWQKFIGLTSFSGSTALLRKPLGDICGHPVTRQFLRDLIEEATTIAFARAARLPANIAEVVFGRLSTGGPGAYASMAVDIIHGRRLELNWLSGRVHQLGLELGIPTPAHTAVYRGLVLHEAGTPESQNRQTDREQ